MLLVYLLQVFPWLLQPPDNNQYNSSPERSWSSIIECHLLSITMWSVWLWVFRSGAVQVYVWMFHWRNIVLPLTTRFCNVAKFTILPVPVAAVWGVGLRPLACWDRGFKSHRGRGCLSVVSVVCCQVEVSATSWSLFQRSPTDCDASLCVI